MHFVRRLYGFRGSFLRLCVRCRLIRTLCRIRLSVGGRARPLHEPPSCEIDIDLKTPVQEGISAGWGFFPTAVPTSIARKPFLLAIVATLTCPSVPGLLSTTVLTSERAEPGFIAP